MGPLPQDAHAKPVVDICHISQPQRSQLPLDRLTEGSYVWININLSITARKNYRVACQTRLKNKEIKNKNKRKRGGISPNKQGEMTPVGPWHDPPGVIVHPASARETQKQTVYVESSLVSRSKAALRITPSPAPLIALFN